MSARFLFILCDNVEKGMILKLLMTISKKESSNDNPIKAEYIAGVAEDLFGGKSDPTFDVALGYQAGYENIIKRINETWPKSKKVIFKSVVINLIKYQDDYHDEELIAAKKLLTSIGINDDNFNMLYSLFISQL
jgi:hypothetical protein